MKTTFYTQKLSFVIVFLFILFLRAVNFCCQPRKISREIRKSFCVQFELRVILNEKVNYYLVIDTL